MRPAQPALRIMFQETKTIARKPPTPPILPTATLSGDIPVKPVRKRAAPKPAAGIPASPGTPRKKATAAGPKKTAEKATRERAAPSRLDQLQTIILASLEDDKAENVVALDLAGRASFTDRMVIATGLADRQISAMAMHLEEKLEEAGLKRVQIEGSGGSDWVLIDAGDIVIHLFKAEAREMYGLERMWGPDLDEAAPAAEDAASV
jgi:ribosome silencing factor RsfS/YbeB/iojap